jgi:dTDP-4-amino-4,6-dideoxygalactose transaminase
MNLITIATITNFSKQWEVMNKVPFLDVGATYQEIKKDIDISISRILEEGWYIGGAEVLSFEQEFASFVNADHCVGVGNGLDAITLSLKAMDIGSGDEVLVPSNTFIATWLAVTYAGAIPIPVEPLETTYNIDPSRLEAACTPRTKAIIVVHLYGQPADLDPILSFARRHNLRLIEDAAQAHGAHYKGEPIGAHSDAVTWSFYPGKNLGAFGDGGAVTSNDATLIEKVRVLGNYGSRTKYVHQIQGVNSRLDPMQAAVLRVKLKHLSEWNTRRARIAQFYIESLANLELKLPEVPSWADPVWHLFVIRHPHRDSLRTYLENVGVGTGIHYPIPPHLQEAYRSLSISPNSLSISEALHQEVLSLPIGPHLSMQQASMVVKAVRDFA